MTVAQRAAIPLLSALLLALGGFLFLAGHQQIPKRKELAVIPPTTTPATTATTTTAQTPTARTIPPPWLLEIPATAPADLRTRLTQAGPVMRPVRIYCESNPTPIQIPNPEWKDDARKSDPDRSGNPRYVRNSYANQYMIARGFKPVFVVYNGTINRAPVWAGAPPQPNLSRVLLDWKREGNFTNPPVESAVKAVAQLALDPTRFGDTLGRQRPIMFDIEAASEINVDPGAPLEKRRAAIQHMIDIVRWARQASQERCDIWFYGYPHIVPFRDDGQVHDLNRALARQLSAMCYFFYNWDASAINNGDHWFSEITLADLDIARLYPEFTGNKVAVLIPVWQIYWPEKAAEIKSMNGKPLPLDLWKRQVDFAIARGWDIMVWTGYLTLEPIKEHIDYVARWTTKP